MNVTDHIRIEKLVVEDIESMSKKIQINIKNQVIHMRKHIMNMRRIILRIMVKIGIRRRRGSYPKHIRRIWRRY